MDCRFFHFLTIIAMTLALAVPPVTSTSEPAALFCEQACWEQDVLAETCETNNNCNSDAMSDDEYMACARPCWAESSACQRMCRKKWERVLDQCRPVCRGDNSREACTVSCFLDRMLTIMARYRRQHNGSLSEFENDAGEG